MERERERKKEMLNTTHNRRNIQCVQCNTKYKDTRGEWCVDTDDDGGGGDNNQLVSATSAQRQLLTL